MSPRTYIGPFGRILPVPEDKEPERLLIPPNAADETRHPLGMYQLPPPERLHFGSDISTGFTEPVRYNTISQSSRTHGASQPMLGDQMARRGQLPSLQQLLTPSTQSNVPTPAPYSPQRSPNPPQQPPSTFSHSHNPSPDRVAHASQYHHHATYHPQSQAAAQVRLPTARSSSRENYQISSPTQNHPSFYGQQPNPRIPPHASSFEPNSQSSFASQLQQPAPPIASGQQQSHPHDLAHTQFQPVPAPPQHMQSLDAPAMYFQGQIGAYPTEIDPRMASEQSPPTPSNSVKPQPRVVAERDVPGEGPSWVYEDGTTCKKVIDGEMVNAQWGVTKAGKPRKRLAIACTTCREKKIKCDPAEPKCVQCEKFGRECRFMTAFRNHGGSPDSSSYDFQARTTFISIKAELPAGENEKSLMPRAPSMDRRKGPKRQISSPEMGRIKSETKTPPCKASPTKRQRAGLPSLLASSPEPKARSLKKAQTVPEPTCSAWDEEPPKVNVHGFGWCNDPFDIDAETTSHYLEAFFDHVNTATYQMFPRRPFLSWARRTESKSPADLMMVYAMLAVGSVFSSKPDHDVQGSLFLGIAEYSVARSHGKFSLQLIHSRLLLALYHFSAGCQQESLDYSGMAIRAASGLRLNFESECRDIKETNEPEYGLNKHARAECRRRAFWSAYLIERLPGLCSEHLCTLQSQDTYLRLPCEDRRYEEQECTPTPYFDNGIIDTHLCEVAKGSVLGPMALSIQISSIWSEILAQVFRSSFRSHEQYLNVFESFYNFTNYRLSSWVRSLPSHLTYSKSNAAICMSNGDVGSFINLHAIYHTAIIKLNRSIRNALLPDSILGRSIKSAIDHARQLLQMIEMMEETIGEAQSSCYRSSNDCRSVEVPFSNPFVGYAILSAVDVLSAGGLLRTCGATINLMESGLAAFKRLNRFWASARLQSKAIQERLDRLIESVSSKAAADKRAWKCTNPLDAGFGTDRDVFYSTEDRNGVTLLDHLESKITENEILIVD